MNIGDIEPAWLWLIIAALLAMAELVAPGVFLVWLAAAAALTGAATLLFGLALPFQLVLFALFSIGTVLLGRRVYERSAPPVADPLLNDRIGRLIGRTVVVASAISGGEGRVKVGDGLWSARGPDAAVGDRVRITGVQDGCLLVTPADPQLPPAR